MRPSIQRSLKKLGYSMIRSTGELPQLSAFRHAPILPSKSTYSPWLNDADFISAFTKVKAHTLVDELRSYELWSLVRESAKYSAGALIEVGVWRGGTGCLIALAAKGVHLHDPVYLCDTFSGVVKAGASDTSYEGGEHSDTDAGIVLRLAKACATNNVRILEGIFPDETAKEITESVFRFAHIDVDVYQSAKESTEYIWPLLSDGGIVVFDDYGTYSCEGVTRFVNEFVARPDCRFVHNANGHAVLIKV